MLNRRQVSVRWGIAQVSGNEEVPLGAGEEGSRASMCVGRTTDLAVFPHSLLLME
jgi:hypothetical protein